MLARWWVAGPLGAIAGFAVGRLWVLAWAVATFALTFDGTDRPMTTGQHLQAFGPVVAGLVGALVLAWRRPNLRAVAVAVGAALGLLLVPVEVVAFYGWDGCGGCG